METVKLSPQKQTVMSRGLVNYRRFYRHIRGRRRPNVSNLTHVETRLEYLTMVCFLLRGLLLSQHDNLDMQTFGKQISPFVWLEEVLTSTSSNDFIPA